MRIDAVVLDMDGLMVDSEPFWRLAEIEKFAEVGLNLTMEQCIQTTGIRIDEVARYWFRRHPWEGPTPEVVANNIRIRVEELVEEKGIALPGVDQVISQVKERGLPLALASSSPMSLIMTVLRRFKLEQYFDVIKSAEFEVFGKPHPAVYLKTIEALKVPAEFCMTFEDTMAGVISAKAACMKAIAVPQAENEHDPRFILADFKLKSLLDFNWAMIDSR
jgi:mannitol-1-/sugar-/sorbitol-6-/2-deoxyglucose-6-phosphatase